MTVVEGIGGGSVVLPCNITPTGDLIWKTWTDLILVKPASGAVIIGQEYKGDVSLVNGADLRINPLRRSRDAGGGDRVFECVETGEGKGRQIQLILLDPITGVSIPQAIDGRVSVTAGTPKTLTCNVTRYTNPPPSYSWRVDDVTVSGQSSNSYTFTPDKSTRTITCTATNRYSGGSVLSVKEVTATLNVLYLDPSTAPGPVIVTENETATLQCSVEGNPPPSFEWRRSGSSEVRSTSADYTIDDVQRSAAGEYTCRYNNTIGSNSITANLIVLYPPDVTVSYDKTTQTLTCSADGFPRNNNFSPWEHRLDGKLLQTLGTQSSGSTATLKLPGTLTYEDTGYYVCQVSNGIKSLKRGQVLITPQSPPVFQTHNTLLTWTELESQSILVPFYTHSNTPNVTVVWEKPGESTLVKSHYEEPGRVRLRINGQSVNIEGTITVLTVRYATQSDEGNYTVTVTNDIYGRPQSKQTAIYLRVVKSVTGGEIGAAFGGGIAVVAVVITIVIVTVLLIRTKRLRPAGPIRPPSEHMVTQFQNVRQEGGDYQGLSINPDYMNTPENQPYGTLTGRGPEVADYEQCDVPVEETKCPASDVATTVPQYEDMSFPAGDKQLEYIDLCSGDTENKEYENGAFQKESSTNYYNM